MKNNKKCFAFFSFMSYNIIIFIKPTTKWKGGDANKQKTSNDRLLIRTDLDIGLLVCRSSSHIRITPNGEIDFSQSQKIVRNRASRSDPFSSFPPFSRKAWPTSPKDLFRYAPWNFKQTKSKNRLSGHSFVYFLKIS